MTPTSASVLLLCGVLWGWAFTSSHVNELAVMRAQFTFSSFVMLKTFLAALTTSSLSFLLLSVSRRPERQAQLDQLRVNINRRDNRGLLATVAGAAALGAGLSLSSSCPGTVYSQIGAGSHTAWAILGGGLCGAALYSALSLQLRGWQSALSYGQPAWLHSSLDEVLHLSRTRVTAALFGLLLAVDVLLELAVPAQSDVSFLLPKHERIFPFTVMPLLAGAVLGLQQLLLLLFTDRTLGSSGSYAALLDLAREAFTPLSGQSSKPPLSSHLPQLLLPLGVLLGSVAWTHYTGVAYKSDDSVSLLQASVGGAVMVFGARMAGGCTSGHGITGCGLLSLRSFLATAVMFVAAIACAVLQDSL